MSAEYREGSPRPDGGFVGPVAMGLTSGGLLAPLTADAGGGGGVGGGGGGDSGDGPSPAQVNLMILGELQKIRRGLELVLDLDLEL